jgi:hypothetical protein
MKKNWIPAFVGMSGDRSYGVIGRPSSHLA